MITPVKLSAIRAPPPLPPMAVSTSQFLLPYALTSPLQTPRSSTPRQRIATFCSSSSSSPLNAQSKFREFPYVSAPLRDLMLDLVSLVESRLDSSLLPCNLPPDVQHFQHPNGSAQASVFVRSGHQSSSIDFILGSWIHSKLPTGGALNITSLSTYLRPTSDAPNFFIDVIQSSPTSLIVILDLPPRVDPILYPDYLKRFYEDTQLDKQRQHLQKLPEVKPYYSDSLYIRALISPVAVLVTIQAEADKAIRIEEIIRDHLHPVAKEMLKIWLDSCACAERKVGESKSAYLLKRDQAVRNKSIEIDLGSTFPRLFGPEVGHRVLGVLRGIYGV